MQKVFLSLLVALLFFPAAAFAQISTGDTGLITTGEGVYGTLTGDQASLGTFVGARIVNPIFAVSGLIFLVLIIFSGLYWMTSTGDSGRVKKAKDIMASSVIGLVIMFIAYAVVRFLLGALGA